jgi:hypothetical protein
LGTEQPKGSGRFYRHAEENVVLAASLDVPTLPRFFHGWLSAKAILEALKGHRFDRNQATMFAPTAAARSLFC